jgi:hypothetical protein
MGQNLESNIAGIESGGGEHDLGNQDANFDQDCYGLPNESNDL